MMVYSDDKEMTGICASIIDEDSLDHKLPHSSENIFVSEKVGWYDVPENSGPIRQTFSPKWMRQHEWSRGIGQDAKETKSKSDSTTELLAESVKEQCTISTA
jgi:hypothetical protein